MIELQHILYMLRNERVGRNTPRFDVADIKESG